MPMSGSRKPASLVAALLTTSLAGTSSAAIAQTAPPPSAPGGAAAVQITTRGLFDEPAPLRKGIEFSTKFLGGDEAAGAKPKNGFYPEMGNQVTGAGWISAGVGYRRWLVPERLLLDAGTGISWRAYKMAHARLEYTPFDTDAVAVGTQVRWQDLTQVSYFGDGPESLELNRSEYGLESVNTVGYAVVRPREWLAVNGRLGWLSSPELGPPSGSFARGNPHTADVFPQDPVYRLREQPDFLHGEASVVVETRDVSGYPTRGGVYRVAMSRFADRDAQRFTFNRYEAEAAHFIPLDRSDNFIIAIRGWVVGTTTDAGQHVPFYLMPSLGGNNTLRGYDDYRFHDRNLALVNTEIRVALMEHIDAVGIFEAGNVAARFGDLNLDKKSYGAGVRVHTSTATIARLDLARSSEGWQVVFRMNDPFRLTSRFNRRTAQVPFAP
jgi:hypothetical protein